jgi:molecular chaperone DnaK
VRTIGIDLGTTNSVAAIGGSVIRTVSNEEAHRVMPSVVAFPPNGVALVGAAAKRRRASDPINTIFSSKRIIGAGWHAYRTTKFRRQYPFDLVENERGQPVFRTRAGNHSPTDIAARIMGALLSTAELDPTQFNAIVCVPAAFDDAARDATVEAARLSGLRDPRVIEEPLATATAYLTTGSERRGTFAVYDLGGGTFDLAILDGSTEPARVLAHGGDAYLGGDDVDLALARWIVDETVRTHGWDLSTDALVFDRVLWQAELAKIRLCFGTQTRVELEAIDPAAPLAGVSLVIDRDHLEALGHDLVARTFAVCDDTLRSAGIKARDLHAVFLAGGATLLPSVRKGVASYFGQLPRCDFDPLEVVCIGASLL